MQLTALANAYAERFVRTIKESCLDQMIFFGEDMLRNAIREFVTHYHLERNHQGVENRLLVPLEITIKSTPVVQKRERLGGLLNYYYREAGDSSFWILRGETARSDGQEWANTLVVKLPFTEVVGEVRVIQKAAHRGLNRTMFHATLPSR